MASTGQFNVVCSGKLTVQLHRTGVLGMFRRPIAADCLHFSISGIQVETPAQFKVGQPVVMDLIVNDLRRYWAFAAVLELLDPTPLVAQREASLAELVANVPVYEIGLTPDLTREQMAALVGGLIS